MVVSSYGLETSPGLEHGNYKCSTSSLFVTHHYIIEKLQTFFPIYSEATASTLAACCYSERRSTQTTEEFKLAIHEMMEIERWHRKTTSVETSISRMFI